eukprot:COSAG01_NODE_44653_length_416_cov_25.406940_2_plen_79_part_01
MVISVTRAHKLINISPAQQIYGNVLQSQSPVLINSLIYNLHDADVAGDGGLLREVRPLVVAVLHQLGEEGHPGDGRAGT